MEFHLSCCYSCLNKNEYASEIDETVIKYHGLSTGCQENKHGLIYLNKFNAVFLETYFFFC